MRELWSAPPVVARCREETAKKATSIIDVLAEYGEEESDYDIDPDTVDVVFNSERLMIYLDRRYEANVASVTRWNSSGIWELDNCGVGKVRCVASHLILMIAFVNKS